MTIPAPEHPESGTGSTEALDSVLVIIEGPGDKTRRRRRPKIPLTPPTPRPPRSDNAAGDQRPAK
jgi:hypothetical protein